MGAPPDNTRNEKHGGEGALSRLRSGQPFISLALEKYETILARWGYTDKQLEKDGLAGDIIRETARQQTVTELLHAAALGAAELGDLEKWENYVKRWGWRSDKSLAAMRNLRELLVTEGDTLILDAIESAEKEINEQHNKTD